MKLTKEERVTISLALYFLNKHLVANNADGFEMLDGQEIRKSDMLALARKLSDSENIIVRHKLY